MRARQSSGAWAAQRTSCLWAPSKSGVTRTNWRWSAGWEDSGTRSSRARQLVLPRSSSAWPSSSSRASSTRRPWPGAGRSHAARSQYMVALGVLKGMTMVLLQPRPSMDRVKGRKKELTAGPH
jgi:hypothetical protein